MKQIWQVIVVGCVFTLLLTHFFEPSYFAQAAVARPPAMAQTAG